MKIHKHTNNLLLISSFVMYVCGMLLQYDYLLNFAYSISLAFCIQKTKHLKEEKEITKEEKKKVVVFRKINQELELGVKSNVIRY